MQFDITVFSLYQYLLTLDIFVVLANSIFAYDLGLNCFCFFNFLITQLNKTNLNEVFLNSSGYCLYHLKWYLEFTRAANSNRFQRGR